MSPLQFWSMALGIWGWAAVLRVLKWGVPLESLVRLMHRHPRNGPNSQELQRGLESYLLSSGRFPFRPPSNCLERGLSAYRLLCRINAGPTLVIGVRHSAQQRLEGHVWVSVAGRPLAEPSENVASYTTIVSFDAAGRQDPPAIAAVAPGVRFR